MNETSWYLRTMDETFGPESKERLIEWARLGRIQPGQEISSDNEIWQRVEEVPFLDMRFSIDIGDGNPRGPFNRAAAEALLASGRLPPTATIVEVREPFASPEPAVEPVVEPVVEAAEPKEAVEKIVEKIVEKRVEVPVEVIKEVIKEVPVEKIVEKVVEVPVEKIVEKIVEKPVEVIKEVIKEVPVEVEKIVLDETRINQLSGEVSDLTAKLGDAETREQKYLEQIQRLEDELRRLPQAASEVADIQAAMHKIMQDETAELKEIIEREKQEFENVKKLYQDRAERLQQRRCEILKRAGANVEEMTRKSLIERPEDPRTTQLRREYEQLQRVHEKAMLDNQAELRKLQDEITRSRAEDTRRKATQLDATQMQAEVQQLRETLQRTERELMETRQQCEELRQREATSKQVLMTRLAALESPSIGTVGTMETNQSREAKLVKLPRWMGFKK